MVYKALYRKYRPMTFSDIVGQDVIIKTLTNMVKKNKIIHAYLFNGPRGTGKTSAAKIFAKTINCLEKKDGEPCNFCQACMSVINNDTPDIIEIDAASNNGVDEIRELKSKINLVPHNFKYKVYIIDEVHMLSTGAFNALLKTLEEPPEHVVFILATTEYHKLPLTIISRCQNFNFKRINPTKTITKLEEIIKNEKIKVENGVTEEIARISDGGLRDAIGTLEQLNSFSDGNIMFDDVLLLSGTISKEETKDFLSLIINKDFEKVFVKTEEHYRNGKDFVKITESLILFLRDLLLYKKIPNFFIQTKREDVKCYEKRECNIPEHLLFYFIEEINLNMTSIQTSVNSKIAFEILILKLFGKADALKENENICDVEVSNQIKPSLLGNDKKIPLPISKEKQMGQADQVIPENAEINQIMLCELKYVLINNTIALAEKKCLNEALLNWAQLKTYLINKELKKIASILLDAEVVAASPTHMILTFKYNNLVDNFEQNKEEIESLIRKLMGRKYIVVALIHEEWLKVRLKFVEMKKNNQKIEIIPEKNNQKPSNIKYSKRRKISIETKEAVDIFGEELIEMKG